MYGIFVQKYRNATVSTFYLTVSVINILSLKLIEQFYHAKINELKMQKSCLKRRSGIEYRVASLFTRYSSANGIIPESLKSIGQF